MCGVVSAREGVAVDVASRVGTRTKTRGEEAGSRTREERESTTDDARLARCAQDGPPPGGYSSIRYGRRIPNTGPTGAAILAVYAGMFTYGFYQIGVGNRERRAVKEEKLHARAVIVPYLQAEEDRRFVRAWSEKKEQERSIMSGVRGWNAEEKVTQSRWMPPGASTRPTLAKS